MYVTGYKFVNFDITLAAALDAEKCGKRKNNRIPVFFIGQDNVGKTSLKKILLGQFFGDKLPSTVGIEFSIVEVDERLPKKNVETQGRPIINAPP